MTDRARGAEAGFTVLELLVALVILTLGLAALAHTVAASLGRASQVTVESTLSDEAQSLLARLGTVLPLRPGLQTGEEGGVDWAISVTPYGTDADRAAWPQRVDAVDVRLTWRSGGQFRTAEWRTLRFVPPPPR